MEEILEWQAGRISGRRRATNLKCLKFTISLVTRSGRRANQMSSACQRRPPPSENNGHGQGRTKDTIKCRAIRITSHHHTASESFHLKSGWGRGRWLFRCQKWNVMKIQKMLQTVYGGEDRNSRAEVTYWSKPGEILAATASSPSRNTCRNFRWWQIPSSRHHANIGTPTQQKKISEKSESKLVFLRKNTRWFLPSGF